VLDVRVTLLPEQKVVDPDAVITGVAIEQVVRKKGYNGSFLKSVMFPYPQPELGYGFAGDVQLRAGKFELLLVKDVGEMVPPIKTFSGLLLLINDPWLVKPFFITLPVTIR